MDHISVKITDFRPRKGNGEWKTCDDGQVCLTYFYFNNMVPNGIDMTYQAMTSCRKYWFSLVMQHSLCCFYCVEYGILDCVFDINYKVFLKSISENPEMLNHKQYQEHHYCNTDNCNKNVFLGDGVQPDGEGSVDDDQSGGAILNATTIVSTFILLFISILF